MSQTESFAKCACQHCGGHIEFPVNGAGRKIPCPHCGKPTLLFLSQIEQADGGGGRSARNRLWLVAAMTVGVAVAAGGTFYHFATRKAQQVAAAPIPPMQISNSRNSVVAPHVPPAKPKPKPHPDPWHGLKAGQVTLEKTGDGHLIYAVGTLTNATQRQRFGVKVELDVLNQHREKIGSATDYTELIEPGKAWKFRALVTDENAKSAKLTKVKEQE